jgi:hypothetical protein
MALEQLREKARDADIHVWPSDGPLYPGEDAPFRYRRGSREVGSLVCETEAECLEYLLAH